MRISLNQTKNTPRNSRNYQQPPINKQLHNIYKNRKKKKHIHLLNQTIAENKTKPEHCMQQTLQLKQSMKLLLQTILCIYNPEQRDCISLQTICPTDPNRASFSLLRRNCPVDKILILIRTSQLIF